MGKSPNPFYSLPLPFNLGTLNCYFFIAYLGFRDIEKYFESNLLFSFTKVVWHLDYFGVLYLTFQHQNCQTYPPPKNAKNILCVYFVFQIILSIFWKTVKRLGIWLSGVDLPPSLFGLSPKFDRFFCEGFPYLLLDLQKIRFLTSCLC